MIRERRIGAVWWILYVSEESIMSRTKQSHLGQGVLTCDQVGHLSLRRSVCVRGEQQDACLHCRCLKTPTMIVVWGERLETEGKSQGERELLLLPVASLHCSWTSPTWVQTWWQATTQDNWNQSTQPSLSSSRLPTCPQTHRQAHFQDVRVRCNFLAVPALSHSQVTKVFLSRPDISLPSPLNPVNFPSNLRLLFPRPRLLPYLYQIHLDTELRGAAAQSS